MRAALLRGSFATVLAVALPDERRPGRGRGGAAPGGRRARPGPLGGPRGAPAPGPRRCGAACCRSTAPTIPASSHGFARALADRSANIVNLSARLVGDPPIYVLGIEVELPPSLDPETLQAALAPVAEEHEVEMTLEAEEDEVL